METEGRTTQGVGGRTRIFWCERARGENELTAENEIGEGLLEGERVGAFKISEGGDVHNADLARI